MIWVSLNATFSLNLLAQNMPERSTQGISGSEGAYAPSTPPMPKERSECRKHRQQVVDQAAGGAIRSIACRLVERGCSQFKGSKIEWRPRMAASA